MNADAERRSIERDLHEGVQQLLVAIAANLEVAASSIESDAAAAKELLAELRDDARQALEKTRRLAERIYPPLLEAGGLVAALRVAAMSVGVKTEIDVAARMTCPPEIAGAVYFSCLDVLEHAAAGTPVAISVRNEEGVVAFEIVAASDVDDERLRDRVEALGGSVTIQQGPAGQITVAGTLPLTG